MLDLNGMKATSECSIAGYLKVIFVFYMIKIIIRTAGSVIYSRFTSQHATVNHFVY